jgi:hypothetical protein
MTAEEARCPKHAVILRCPPVSAGLEGWAILRGSLRSHLRMTMGCVEKFVEEYVKCAS